MVRQIGFYGFSFLIIACIKAQSSFFEREAYSRIQGKYVDQTENIIEKTVRSKIHCFIFCINTQLCSSIIYTERDGRCFLLYSQIDCYPNNIQISSTESVGLNKPVLMVEKPGHLLLSSSVIASIYSAGKCIRYIII